MFVRAHLHLHCQSILVWVRDRVVLTLHLRLGSEVIHGLGHFGTFTWEYIIRYLCSHIGADRYCCCVHTVVCPKRCYTVFIWNLCLIVSYRVKNQTRFDQYILWWFFVIRVINLLHYISFAISLGNIILNSRQHIEQSRKSITYVTSPLYIISRDYVHLCTKYICFMIKTIISNLPRLSSVH